MAKESIKEWQLKYENVLTKSSYKDNAIALQKVIIDTQAENIKLLRGKLAYKREIINQLEAKLARQKKVIENICR